MVHKYTYNNISLRRISFFSDIRSPRSVTTTHTKTPSPPAPQKMAPTAQPLSACYSTIETLRSSFKGNPSPVRISRSPANTASSPVIPSAGVHFATTTTNQQAAATASPLQASTATTFDPMAFMKQFADQIMAVQQKSQTIVVKSHEDKTRETEA